MGRRIIKSSERGVGKSRLERLRWGASLIVMKGLLRTRQLLQIKTASADWHWHWIIDWLSRLSRFLLSSINFSWHFPDVDLRGSRFGEARVALIFSSLQVGSPCKCLRRRLFHDRAFPINSESDHKFSFYNQISNFMKFSPRKHVFQLSTRTLYVVQCKIFLPETITFPAIYHKWCQFSSHTGPDFFSSSRSILGSHE